MCWYRERVPCAVRHRAEMLSQTVSPDPTLDALLSTRPHITTSIQSTMSGEKSNNCNQFDSASSRQRCYP